MTSDTEVVYRKYDGRLHWNYRGVRLGEDEHGAWVGCPPGTPGRLGGGHYVTWQIPCVTVFPRDAWWTATFNPAGQKAAVYCDIATVPEWRDGGVTMVDLDLDVIRLQDGTVYLDDEDEFAEHQIWFGYPADVIEHARHAADWLLSAVAGGDGPFGGAHARWLKRVSSPLK